MNVTVVKIGGRALEAPDAAEQLADAASRIGGRVVFVHGGGAEVTEWCGRMGVDTTFVDGLRVTGDAVLPVAAAVLAGLANKRLVAKLRAAGVDAVGISGADGGILDAAWHLDRARLGSVGVVNVVRPALLRALLMSGWTPVVASIGAIDGALVNLNADEVARALAAALRVETLLLLSDVKALMLDGAPVGTLKETEAKALLDHPQVIDGMRTKIRAAHATLAEGVHRVVIGAWSGPDTLVRMIEGRSDGTTLVKEKAGVEDASHV